MKLRFRFGMKSILAAISLVAFGIVLIQSWIVPWKRQQAVFVELVDYGTLEPVAELPAWKRLIAATFGEHSVCHVTEVVLEAGYEFDVETIRSLTDIKKLSICGQDPLMRGYDAISGFSELEELVFERCRLDDVSSFSALKNLKKLGFYDLADFDSGAEVFGGLPELKILWLRYAPLDQIQVDGIATSTSVEELSLNLNRATTNLSALSSMKQLTKLVRIVLFHQVAEFRIL